MNDIKGIYSKNRIIHSRYFSKPTIYLFNNPTAIYRALLQAQEKIIKTATKSKILKHIHLKPRKLESSIILNDKSNPIALLTAYYKG